MNDSCNYEIKYNTMYTTNLHSKILLKNINLSCQQFYKYVIVYVIDYLKIT